jgi:hypothetical protein
MYERFPELVDAIRKRFEFAGLKPEHNVAIMANTDSFKPCVDAAYTAALSMGTKPVLITVPFELPFKDIPKIAEKAAIEADFFVDMQHLNWYYTGSLVRVLSARQARNALSGGVGSREEDVETIIRNVPSNEKVERAKKAQALIDKAKVVRVTTREGTDYHVKRGDPTEFPAFTVPPMNGQVAFAPPDESVEGVIQCVGALRIQAPLPERFHVRQPLRMELKAGRVTKIDRGTPEGAYLDDWFRSFGRPDAYNFAHVNLGLVRLSIRHIDNEAIHFAYGGVLNGFGIRGTPVFGTPLGDLPNHLDLHMSNASYYVDDMPILKDGQFTPESGLEFAPGELPA